MGTAMEKYLYFRTVADEDEKVEEYVYAPGVRTI